MNTCCVTRYRWGQKWNKKWALSSRDPSAHLTHTVSPDSTSLIVCDFEPTWAETSFAAGSLL